MSKRKKKSKKHRRRRTRSVSSNSSSSSSSNSSRNSGYENKRKKRKCKCEPRKCQKIHLFYGFLTGLGIVIIAVICIAVFYKTSASRTRGLFSNAQFGETEEVPLTTTETAAKASPWSACSQTCNKGVQSMKVSENTTRVRDCFVTPCVCSFFIIYDDPSTDEDLLTLGRITFTGSVTRVYYSIDQDAVAVAYDPISRLTFWATSRGDILRQKQPIYQLNKELGALVLDYARTLLFASGIGYGIVKGNYTVKSFKWITVGEVEQVHSLALWTQEKLVYWLDEEFNLISKCKYSGTQRERFGEIEQKAYGLNVDADSKKLFWVTHEESQIYSSPLDKFEPISTYEVYFGSKVIGMVICKDHFYIWDKETDGGRIDRITKSGEDREKWPDKQIPRMTSMTVYGY